MNMMVKMLRQRATLPFILLAALAAGCASEPAPGADRPGAPSTGALAATAPAHTSAAHSSAPGATPGPSRSPSGKPGTATRPEGTPGKAAGSPAAAGTYRATLSAVGDILIHNTVYQDAADGRGGYDFKPMLAPAAEELRKPGILVANQESVMGGKGLGLSSYPQFNSPFEIGDALKDAGVDLVTMANNHTMDKGEAGIRAAIGRYDQIGMPHTGAYASEEDRRTIRFLESGGIRFAFLAYTYGTNGIAVPADKPYLVALLDPARVQADMAEARKQADALIVCVHWGIENQPNPSPEQREWAKRLADWGADVVVGTHPHVLQPMEWLSRADGGRTLVMYSLGNFLSAQDQPAQLIGGIARVEVVKTVDAGGRAALRLEHPVLQPTYNRYANWRNYRVIPFDRLEQADRTKLAPSWAPIKARLLKAMPELELKE